MVMPGLINIHSHPTSEPLRKGVTDEIRSPVSIILHSMSF